MIAVSSGGQKKRGTQRHIDVFSCGPLVDLHIFPGGNTIEDCACDELKSRCPSFIIRIKAIPPLFTILYLIKLTSTLTRDVIALGYAGW